MLKSAVKTTGYVSYTHLAALLAGVSLAGSLASTMSTADSQLLAASSGVSENILGDVYKRQDKGIEIYFEKENIWTLDSKGELLITIMSSLEIGRASCRARV